MNTSLLCPVVLFLNIAGLVAQAPPAGKQPPTEEKAAEKSPVQMKAEAIILPKIGFSDVDVDVAICYLRKKSIECDPEKDANRKGLNLNIRPGAQAPRNVTLTLRNVSLWDAVQETAAQAGLEVSVQNNMLVVHGKDAKPGAKAPANPINEALEKSAVWQRAAGLTVDRVQFAEADMADVCAHLKRKSQDADKEKKGVEISAAEDLQSAISLDVRNVKLTDLLQTVAELAHAEITVSGDKIILKPAK